MANICKNFGKAHEKRDEFVAFPVIHVHPQKASFTYAKFLCSTQNRFDYVHNQPDLNQAKYVERAKRLSFHA